MSWCNWNGPRICRSGWPGCCAHGYLEWGGDDGSRQQRWREFLTHEDPKEQSIRRADWVVGDKSFQKRLQGHQGSAVQRRRGRPPKSGGQEAGILS